MPPTRSALVGKMLHDIYKRTLSSEIELLEKLEKAGKLDIKSIRDLYRRTLKETSLRIFERYVGRLRELGEPMNNVLYLLGRFFENVVKERTYYIFKKIKNIGVSGLIPIFTERSFERLFICDKYGVYGSPDIIENNIIYELKYAGPPPKGSIREDFLLQVVWYSILSGIRDVCVTYLPSLKVTRIKVNKGFISWAQDIKFSLLDFLEEPYEVEHTCNSERRYIVIRGDFLGGSLPTLIPNSTVTI